VIFWSFSRLLLFNKKPRPPPDGGLILRNGIFYYCTTPLFLESLSGGQFSMYLSSTKSLAIPAPGKQPTFDEVTSIVLTGACFGLSVCVMCLTQEMLERWMGRLQAHPKSVTLLDVLNTNRATLADWKAFLGSQPHDITVLSGVQSELQAGQLSVGYLKALVEAVPAGLVMVT
jgi:hypothetical protein